MLRSLLASILFIAALSLGLYVAGLASSNRSRGADFDRRQHESETLSRQNKYQRARNQQDEYQLLQSQGVESTSIVEPISD